jgi:hypothetical protein
VFFTHGNDLLHGNSQISGSAPMVGESNFQPGLCPASTLTVTDREKHLAMLKENLLQAQQRMKFYADKNRTERSFQVGDMVYLKI